MTGHSPIYGGLLSALVQKPVIGWTFTLSAMIAGLAVFNLSHGEYPITIGELLVSPDDPQAEFILWSLRLPRLISALVVGGRSGSVGSTTADGVGQPAGRARIAWN